MLLSMLKYGLRTSKVKNNQFDFLDLLRAPTGSHIIITSEQKQKPLLQINQDIDIKLQQLEDTGLSRQEILLSKSQKGISLAIDPFFQYIKRNRLAREVYLKKNDLFTVEKVVDIALRQDIGPDPSYSRTRQQGRINQKGRAQLMNDLPSREMSSFDPASYYANQQTSIPKLYDQLKPHQPLRHIYKPINRYEKIKTHMRRLKKYDIHWRNVELLRQFLTPYGNIRNRMINCLSAADQKKINMAIKTARHNAAIPHYGRILPPNRKNITNLEDQVKQLGLQNINLETGQIYYSRSRSMDSIQTEFQRKNDLDVRYDKLIKGNKYTLWVDQLDKQVDQQTMMAQKFARVQKQRQNKQNGRQMNKNKYDVRKMALKSTGLSDEQSSRVEKDSSEEAQSFFRKRKQSTKNKLQTNIFLFSDIMLEEKTI